MYFADMQSFIKYLEETDDLKRLKSEVDPVLEAAEIISNVCKETVNNKALFFEKVRGSKLALTSNLFGSKKRVAKALGVTDIEALANKLRADLELCKEIDCGPALAEIIARNCSEPIRYTSSSFSTKEACTRGLGTLPALQCWPGDGGRYITLGQVITRAPGSDQQNCGMYRIQIVDDETALLRCHSGSDGSAHLAAWHEEGKAMPVAIVLGGPPALTWCAGVSLPKEVSEFEFTSYLTGQPISVTKSVETGLLVPSTAEIVIEGYVSPGEEQPEGPFGNHTGYYSQVSGAPVIKVKRIFTRDNAVYPCTVVGPPPMENIYMAQAIERLMLPLVQHKYPWLIDVHMPLEGIYHRAAFVAVDALDLSIREISKQLRQTMLLRNSRLLVLLDPNSDLQDASNVYWHVLNADSWESCVHIDEDKMTIDARSSSKRKKILQ